MTRTKTLLEYEHMIEVKDCDCPVHKDWKEYFQEVDEAVHPNPSQVAPPHWRGECGLPHSIKRPL